MENYSESEIEVIDRSDNYYDEEDNEVAVTDDYGSYDEVTLNDGEESYHSNLEFSHGNINNDQASLALSNGEFTNLDEVDDNYLDEILTEGVSEDDDEEEVSMSSVPSYDILSESDSFNSGYSRIHDVDNSAAESSLYDADVDATSQHASSASSYYSAINDDPRRRHQNSKSASRRRIKTTKEFTLGISSTSFRVSSFISKDLSKAATTMAAGDNSIISTGQSPSLKKNVLRTPTRSRRSSKRSESSSTMASGGTCTNSRRSLKTNRKEKSRRPKSQKPPSGHIPSIQLSRENSEERSHESVPSTASRSTPVPISRVNNESNQLERRKRNKNIPLSSASSTRSHINDGRCTSIAVLGTMSGTGKSIIAAALCRIFANGGTKCAPFKSQITGKSTSPALLPDLFCRDSLYDSFAAMVEKNICNERTNNGHVSSLSTAPTKQQGYGQIGIAQSMQAEACKIVPRVQMNPIFLKSGGKNEKDESMCTMIVMGKQIIRETHKDISKRIPALQSIVLDSHLSLASVTGAEVIVIQGAGSCSELNLMDGDIINLPLVRCLQCPWLLVANGKDGGVFAQVVGTKMCVSKRDWDLCVGVIINKVKSEIKEFLLGLKMLEKLTGKPLYAMPFVEDLDAPNEEVIDIEMRLTWEKQGYSPTHHQHEANKLNKLKREKPSVVVVAYPHTTVSNDLYSLEKDSRFHLEWRRKRLPKPYPTTTAVILPGSRLSLLDLKWLQDYGWADFIRKHVAAGGTVLGLCGGYQMLGWEVNEGTNSKQGIGLLPITSTTKAAECSTIDPLKGQLYPSGTHIEGFEVNCGFSKVVLSEQRSVADGRYEGIAPLIAYENGKPEGMRLGRVQGTYLHGILRSSKARVELLVPIQDRKQFRSVQAADTTSDPLDKFAKHLETCGLGYDALRKMAFGKSSTQ